MSQTPTTAPLAELLPADFSVPDAAGYYPESDLSGGLPINLDSLRDGPPGSKPFYPYSTLIRYAIKGSPAGKLLLEDIYYAIESRFPYFRTAPAGWKNSVRHNLSLNPCFVKVARPLTDRGKGSYWTVDDNVDPRTGVHRVRKKKTKKGKAATQEPEPVPADFSDAVEFAAAQVQAFDAPPPEFASPLDESGEPRDPAYSTPAYSPAFDPAFQVFARYPGGGFDEHLPVDANGQVDWRMAWHNELANLQRMTEEQDKLSGAGDEWYRLMLVRLKLGLFTTFAPPSDLFVPQPAPPGVALSGMLVGQPETSADGQAHE